MLIGIPIPILNPTVLQRACIRDRDIQAPVTDYSHDYPQKTGKVLAHVSYEELRSGSITLEGKEIPVGALSSYSKAIEIAERLADEVRRGDFRLSEPYQRLPVDQGMKGLTIKEKTS